MEVTLEKKDALHATLKVNISKEDYAPKIEAELKKAQKKVNVPGFRPGHAPMGMVKKMYGKSIFVDEVNKLASDSMFGYLRKNNIDFLAQPLLSDGDQKIDFDKEEDFEFAFDLGLAPEIKLNISEKDKLTRYKITVGEADVEKEIENIQRRHAKQETAESAEEKDIIYLKATELDENGEVLEGGLADKDLSTTIDIIKNEELKNRMLGLKPGDEFTADIFEMFNGNEAVLSNSLGIQKEAVNDLNKNFKFVVTELKRFVNHEVNQELFDQVFGPDQVKSLEEFKERLKTGLEDYYKGESENMFEHELDHVIQDKHRFELPANFLKRWLMENNPDTFTPENVDEKFAPEASQLRYVLLRNKILKDNNIEVSDEEVEYMSLAHSAEMIRKYGIPNPDEALVRRVAEGNKKEEGYMSRMADMAAQRRFIEFAKTLVTPVEKEVGVEEFYEIVNKHNHEHNH